MFSSRILILLNFNAWLFLFQLDTKLKLVDYGADGAYAGDLYQPIVTVTEAATQETWTRVVLPLSDFTTNADGVNQPLTADGKIGQILFENDGSEGAGTETFYIDNIYFY